MDDKELKYEELKQQHKLLHRKYNSLLKDGSVTLPKKDLLGLIPGKLYLLITDGRRLVGKLEYEAKSFVCYTKRDGVKYYANKSYIKLIKELSNTEQEGYLKSNFDNLVEEDND